MQELCKSKWLAVKDRYFCLIGEEDKWACEYLAANERGSPRIKESRIRKEPLVG